MLIETDSKLPPLEERPLVTFALFAYNQEKYIREAVEGAFSQTYEPLEIILSDDCSTDRTFEIMQEMAAEYKGPHRVMLQRNNSNEGLARHINKIIRLSVGKIISWAAGDDIAMPNRTSQFVSKLQESNNYVGVHSNIDEIDLRGEYIKLRYHSFGNRKQMLNDVFKYGLSVITQSHAFRREVFDVYGPLEDEVTNEGIVMAFRELTLGEVAFIKQSLTKYRIGSGVSTYSGYELERRKIDEPIKITRWYLTAYKQIFVDLKRCPIQISDQNKKLILNKIEYFKNISKINKRVEFIKPIIHNLYLFPSDLKTFRALIRILTPNIIYKIKLR